MENVNLKEFDIAFLNYINGDYDKLSDVEREIFVENRKPLDYKNITLRVLCDGLGIEVPDKFKDIADEKQRLAFREFAVNPDDICIILKSAEEIGLKETTSKDQYEKAIEKKAKIIIMGKEDFEKFNLKEDNYPVILLDHKNERYLRFFSLLREQNKAKVVQVTGSIGKTTTKNICNIVLKNRMNMFANAKNANSIHRTANNMLYKINDKNKAHIQETGAGYKGSIREAASILQPDIFVLTNVYAHHIEAYGSFENVFEDKVSPDDYMSKDGIIITNYDDEGIRNHTFKHKVVSFAIKEENVDFRAINIKQENVYLKFDIYEKATDTTTPVKVKVLGDHNVYNILAAFALAKVMGVDEESIQEDLEEFRTDGIRQNLLNIGGIYFNFDCYNVAEESIISMLKAGENFELEEGGKKYAVIGGENKLGDGAKARNEAFGRRLGESVKVDKILFCRGKKNDAESLNKYGDGESIKKGFDSVSNIPSSLSKNVKGIMKFLDANVKRNDLVMLKGIYMLSMSIAVDKLYGSSVSFNVFDYYKKITEIKLGALKVNYVPRLRELELFDAKIKAGKLIIPNGILILPVFRIKGKAFKNNLKIKEIDFGKKVKNLGDSAFEGCTNLKKLEFPSNIRVIEPQCFRNCTNLESLKLNDGLLHISSRAFQKCEKLGEVFIPSSVGMIEDNAFKNCKNLVILCEKDSVAHKYALANNIPCKVK